MNQTDIIIAFWPGTNHVERRKALADALQHPDDQKVRYWQRKGEIPQRDWPAILEAGAALEIPPQPEDFVRHLKDPAEDAARRGATA